MLKRVCLLITLLLSTPCPLMAGEIVALLSSPAAPYTKAFLAFQRHYITISPSHGLKAIQPDTIKSITLGTATNNGALSSSIKARQPDLIVAFGSKALARALALTPQIPIVYLLVPTPEKFIQPGQQVTGVLLQPQPGAEFKALQRIFPAARRVGVLYNPATSTDLIRTTMANSPAFTFIRKPVTQAKEVDEQLTGLAGRIDLLWLPADRTILVPEAEQSLYRFSLQHKIPILAFAEKYLRHGATFAIGLDLGAMGRRAATLADKIIKGTPAGRIRPVRLEEVELTYNPAITNKLNLDLQEAP